MMMTLMMMMISQPITACYFQLHLPADAVRQHEAVSRLKRQLAGCIEMVTRQLERLDGLSLAYAADQLKGRRKTTVCQIQVHHRFL